MLSSEDTSELQRQRLKVKGWEMILQANSIHGKAGVAILISDKIDFKITRVTRDKDGHFIIRGILNAEDITLLNIYTPNQGEKTHQQSQK